LSDSWINTVVAATADDDNDEMRIVDTRQFADNFHVTEAKRPAQELKN